MTWLNTPACADLVKLHPIQCSAPLRYFRNEYLDLLQPETVTATRSKRKDI